VVRGEVGASEGAPGELEAWAMSGEEVEEGAGVVFVLVESGGCVSLSFRPEGVERDMKCGNGRAFGGTYSSKGQSSLANTWITSGRLREISL